ncbi:MAG: hypothetical protein PHX68_03330 [Alphaproteobacteria bacterium]|nr:hypothetical protein [Alphaproteobacteria bacterium]
MSKVQQLFSLRERSTAHANEMEIKLYRADRGQKGLSTREEGSLFIQEDNGAFKCRVSVSKDSPIVAIQADKKLVISVYIPDGRHLGDVYIADDGVLVHFGMEPPEARKIAKKNGNGRKKAARGARELGE